MSTSSSSVTPPASATAGAAGAATTTFDGVTDGAAPPPPPSVPPPPSSTDPTTSSAAAAAAAGSSGGDGLPGAGSSTSGTAAGAGVDGPSSSSTSYSFGGSSAGFQLLEQDRCKRAEMEACILFASSLLLLCAAGGTTTSSGGQDGGSTAVGIIKKNEIDLSKYDVVGVRDAWHALSRISLEAGGMGGASSSTTSPPTTTMPGSTTRGDVGGGAGDSEQHDIVKLGTGQFTTALIRDCLYSSLQRASMLANEIDQQRHGDHPSRLVENWQVEVERRTNDNQNNLSYYPLLAAFDERLRSLQQYHARVGTTASAAAAVPGMDSFTASAAIIAGGVGKIHNKRPRSAIEDYDLVSTIVRPAATELQRQIDDEMIGGGSAAGGSASAALGKYLDLTYVYDNAKRRHLKDIIVDESSSKASTANNNNSNGSSNAAAQKLLSTYLDFLNFLLRGLDECCSCESSSKSSTSTSASCINLPEERRLKNRKSYIKFLHELEMCLREYLNRTSPFLDVDAVVVIPAVVEFKDTWKRTGGYEPAWRAISSESPMSDLITVAAATPTEDPSDRRDSGEGGDETNVDSLQTKQQLDPNKISIDLSKFGSAAELSEGVDGNVLKAELARLGLKCGGTVLDRAKRLWTIKELDGDRTKWPQKLLAKKKQQPSSTSAGSGTVTAGSEASSSATASASLSESAKADPRTISASEPRVLVAWRQVAVGALLQYVRPTLEATARRAERRQTQTEQEQQRELYEDLYQGFAFQPKKKKSKSGDDEAAQVDSDDEDDDEDDEDAPIYNPKNVPLDWDGKPIPYWLFKLHGLNHYYKCEICGGESYRGRRNYETHFADTRHALGMKALGIPNTKHFHGVAKIQDALDLYETLKSKLSSQHFDSTTQEEYEDSHGNVLTRTAYEDLARQGLL